MAIATDNKGQIVPRNNGNGQALAEGEKKPMTLSELTMSMKGAIEQCIPKHLTAERMTRIALTALRTNADLQKCSPHSFIASLMACSMLGLEPNTPLGQAYLIPRNNKNNTPGVKDCTLVIGYQGMLDLARRSRDVASVQAFAVYAGDMFEYELGLAPFLKHKPSDAPDREDDKKLTHAYCIVKLKDAGAGPIFVVLTRAQIEKRRKRGGSRSFSPWESDYEEMAKKTAVRACMKWAPRTAEIATAIDVDERNERGAQVAPALPAEVQQLLLESGRVAEADFVDDEQKPEPPEPGSDG